MAENGIDLLAYCGLYCGDCAGYSGDIAESAKALADVLRESKFDRTARQLFVEQLGEFGQWFDRLEFLAGLKCDAVCRQRDVSCEIAKCCVESGYLACYECQGLEECQKLKWHEGLHGDSHLRNLQAMREMGAEAWIASGVRLWFAGDADEAG
jgi:hypothetical protein